MSASPPSSPLVERWLWRLALVAALAAAAVAVRFVVFGAAQPPEIRLRDDAYYYFVWATHLANGQGPCVTLGEPTSGVHWLWAFVMTVVARIGGVTVPHELAEPARWLGLGLHVATAACVARLVPARARLVAAALYLGNPFLLHEAQNGQATALACALLAALLAFGERRRAARVLLAILCVLARSDAILFVIALGFAWEGRRWRALVPALVALGVLLATNLWITGRLTQDSTWPLPWLFWRRFLASDPDFATWMHHVWFQLRPCLLSWPFTTTGFWPAVLAIWAGLRPVFGVRGRAWPLLVVAVGYVLGARDWSAALVATVLVLVLPRDDRAGEGATRVPVALLCAGGLLAFTHYVLRLNAPPHYFAVFGVAGIVGFGRLATSSTRFATGVALASAVCAALDARRERERFPAQIEMVAAAEIVRAAWPELANTPLGSFNCGILTASHAGRVVDLDGLVNATAFAAARERALGAYLDRQGLALLVDWPAMFGTDRRNPHASGELFGEGFRVERDLVEVARFDAADHDGGWPGTDSVRLYWRVGHGPRPPGLPAPRIVRIRDGSQWFGCTTTTADALTTGPLGADEARTPLGTTVPGVATFFLLPSAAPGTSGVFRGSDREPLVRF